MNTRATKEYMQTNGFEQYYKAYLQKKAAYLKTARNGVLIHPTAKRVLGHAKDNSLLAIIY